MAFDPLSFAGDLFGGVVNNLFANSRQEDAQNFSAQQYATRYQTQVKDLKSAGLNPMMAYMQAPGPSPQSSAASASGFEGIGSRSTQASNQSQMAAAQVENVKADTQNKLESSALIRAQTAKEMSSANQLDAAVTKIGQEVMNLKEQFKNIPLEGDRLRSAIYELNSSAELKLQQGMSQQQVRDQLRAAIAKLDAETDLLKLDYEAARDLGNIGREAGQLKPVVDILRSVIRK